MTDEQCNECGTPRRHCTDWHELSGLCWGCWRRWMWPGCWVWGDAVNDPIMFSVIPRRATRGLFCGRTGSGKTTLPALYRPAWLDQAQPLAPEEEP